jgi:hypothetical protein
MTYRTNRSAIEILDLFERHTFTTTANCLCMTGAMEFFGLGPKYFSSFF